MGKVILPPENLFSLEDTFFPFLNFSFSPSLLLSWVDSMFFKELWENLVLSANKCVHFKKECVAGGWGGGSDHQYLD